MTTRSIRLLLQAASTAIALVASGGLLPAFTSAALLLAAPAAGAQGAEPTRREAPALEPPRLLEAAPPAYPPAAVERRVEGTVVLLLTIGADGSVQAAEVAESVDALLDEAAREAAMGLRFAPATRDGQAIAARIRFPYTFELPPLAAAARGRLLLPGANERPAVGVRMVLGDGAAFSAEMLTDEQGRFAFEELPAGIYQLQVDAPGLGHLERSLTLDEGQQAEWELQLLAPAEEEAIEVVVQGESEADELRGSARAVQVVETEEARRQTADLGEVLARSQGVGVRREGGLGASTRISLNGFSDDQIRFFLDGVPLELSGFPFGMANVPVNLVERVEIYRGVVPIRFGADALGGALNLVSAPLEMGTHGSASYQLGSWGTHRATASVSHLHEPTGLVARASGFFDHAENDYTVAATERAPAWERFHDGYRAAGGTVEAGFVDRSWARRLLLRLSVADYEKELQHNAVMTRPYGEVVYGGSTLGASLHYEQPLGAGLDLEVIGGHTWSERFLQDLATCPYRWDGSCNQEVHRPGEIDAGAQDDVWTDRNAYGRLNLSWQLHPDHELRFSTSPTFFTRTGDDRLDQPGQRDPLSAEHTLFAVVSGVEYESNLFDGRLQNIVFVKDYRQALRSEERLDSGLYEERDVDLHRTGVGDSLRYLLADGLYGKASWEWATRLPRPDEFFGNGVLVDPNLRLQPETSHNFNLGFALEGYDTALGSLRADVNGFLREADDLIVILGQDIRLQYQNVYAARSVGVEAAAGWTSPDGHFALDGNLTFLDMRNLSDEGTFSRQQGDRIPNQPWLFGNVSARVQTDQLAQRGDRAALVWNSRYVGEFFRKWESLGRLESKAVIPAQLVHALALVYSMEAPLGEVSFTGEVQNLGDAAVFDSYGAQRPGRSFYFKTTATF